MAEKKEWLLRGVSFLMGFLTGRYAFPKQKAVTISDVTRDFNQLEEHQIAEASRYVVGGIYRYLRCFAEDPTLFELGRERIGPRALQRLEYAMQRWSMVISELGQMSPNDLDNIVSSILKEMSVNSKKRGQPMRSIHSPRRSQSRASSL
ncbi:hypothetical protein IH992_34525 [Candidatus Poribacteria bacterium]|nr:hypothetical protein [Candidatus Poribacteria bacterium]